MSNLEKQLYKQITVPSARKQKSDIPGSRTYRGISTVNAGNSTKVLYDLALIKQDIINHFHIRQGEKLSDPEFGTIIWDILYEPFTNEVQELVIEDVTTIINYDPRVRAEEIIVDTYEQGLQVECTITFLPYQIVDQLRFKFDKENGLLS